MRKIAAALAFSVLMLGACSSDNPVPVESRSTDTSVEAEEASTTTEATTTTTAEVTTTTTVPDVDPMAYFESIFNGDIDDPDALVADAVPGSPADLYGRHQINLARALRDGGVSSSGPTVIRDGDEIKTCEKDSIDQETYCTTFAMFVGDDGLLYSFDVTSEGGPTIAIEERLGGEGAPTGAVGTEARVLSSYRAASDVLFVVVEFTASAPSNLDLFGASYVDPSGRQVQALDAVGPFDLREGAKATTYVAFEQADSGGQLFISANSADFSAMEEFRLEVPKAGF